MFYNFQCPALNFKIKSERELEKKNARNVAIHCYIRMQRCVGMRRGENRAEVRGQLAVLHIICACTQHETK